MNLEEAFDVFPHLRFLIQELRSDWPRLTVDERVDAVDKIIKEWLWQSDNTRKEHHSRTALINLAKKALREYAAFQKNRQGRPMTFNNGGRVQRWLREELDVQRFHFLFKDINFALKLTDATQIRREFEALNQIFEPMNNFVDVVTEQLKEERVKNVIDYLWQLAKIIRGWEAKKREYKKLLQNFKGEN